MRLRREHPRVCGENDGVIADCGEGHGTSPRMRGKPGYGVFDGSDKRNIPAYAGKTVVAPLLPDLAKEHPRVCGENRDTGRLASSGAGNIPAYAGKTSNIIGRRSGATEHPRVCGENGWGAFWCPRRRGTSPRMRGKPYPGFPRCPGGRNIPAYAGKTIYVT